MPTRRGATMLQSVQTYTLETLQLWIARARGRCGTSIDSLRIATP